MRDPFSVHTPADSPYGVLFAFASASSGVRNVSTDSTGPKISSRAMRWVWATSDLPAAMAGTAMPTRIRKGMMVQTISTVVLS